MLSALLMSLNALSGSGNLCAAVLTSDVEAIRNFNDIFQLKGRHKLTYQVTDTFPSESDRADALEKSKPIPHNAPESKQLASFEAYAIRVRKGYQSLSMYNIYVSDMTDLVVEQSCFDEWNKGIVIKSYFSPTNLIEISPSAKTVIIKPTNASMQPELLANFPALHNLLGLTPDAVRMVPEGAFRWFLLGNKTSPVVYLFKVSPRGMLLKSEERDYLRRLLNSSEFQYSSQQTEWPSDIGTTEYSTDGTVLCRETWHLIGSEELPPNFDFRPTIERSYRVSDQTGSKIPVDEMNQLLNK